MKRNLIIFQGLISAHCWPIVIEMKAITTGKGPTYQGTCCEKRLFPDRIGLNSPSWIHWPKENNGKLGKFIKVLPWGTRKTSSSDLPGRQKKKKKPTTIEFNDKNSTNSTQRGRWPLTNRRRAMVPRNRPRNGQKKGQKKNKQKKIASLLVVTCSSSAVAETALWLPTC